MDIKKYDSAVTHDPLEIKALYYNAIAPTTVCFVRENIAVSMDSLGHFEFADGEGKRLAVTDHPVSDDPSEYGHSAQYGEIRCACDGKAITLFLPVYGWYDTYPNCDGESDRWDRYTSRWFRIVFDCESKEIAVLDK